MSDECARCPKPGMCCEFMELQLAGPLSGDAMRWVALHDGVSIVERDGATFVHLDIICGALTEEGTCALHGTPDRPRMCEGWPYGDPVLHQAPEGCVFLDEFRLREVEASSHVSEQDHTEPESEVPNLSTAYR